MIEKDLFLLLYFYVCDSCKVTLQEHFSKIDFLNTPNNQINILCCFFRYPKSLHFSGEEVSNSKFFLSGCFFPRLCKCGTIF